MNPPPEAMTIAAPRGAGCDFIALDLVMPDERKPTAPFPMMKFARAHGVQAGPGPRHET